MIFSYLFCIISDRLLPRLTLAWLKPSLSSTLPFIPTICKLGEYLKLEFVHVNYLPRRLGGLKERGM